jgi:tetratricopeptide (TPR) repeat protein
LLTCEPSDLQEPESALRFATEANEMTDYENPAFLDTRALAYHRTGDTVKAIELGEKALARLPEDADRTEYERRLAEFETALKSRGD